MTTTAIALSLRRTLAAPGGARALVERLRAPTVGLMVLGIGVLVTVAYLLLVNDTATRGLSLETYERQIRQLKDDTRQLEVDLANLQSFATVTRTSQALELTQQISPEFVVVPDGHVAVR